MYMWNNLIIIITDEGHLDVLFKILVTGIICSYNYINNTTKYYIHHKLIKPQACNDLKPSAHMYGVYMDQCLK